MKNKQIVGIDVSKNVLDIYILHLKYHFTVSNNPSGFVSLICMTSKHIGLFQT